MAIFFSFKEKKQGALLSTNVAARGLDIPEVDWIIQVDCPEDTKMYIHRVGRTARYKSNGKALLFIMPEEIKFTQHLEKRKVKINTIKVQKKNNFLIVFFK